MRAHILGLDVAVRIIPKRANLSWSAIALMGHISD